MKFRGAAKAIAIAVAFASSVTCVRVTRGLAADAAPAANHAATGVPEIDPLRFAPANTDGKLIDVAVGLHLINVSSVDEVAQTFQIDGYLFERWNDPRLAFTPSGPDDQRRLYRADEIWVPRVEMVNATEPRQKYDTRISVKPDGTVDYVERYKAVLSTKFALRRFPFDTQRLVVDLHPFVSAAHLVKFSLNDHKTWMSSELETYSSLAQWDLEAVTPELGQGRLYDGSAIPKVTFAIQVQRRSHFYLWKVFLPLTLMVFLSWAVFFVEPRDLTNQVTIAVTTILTVIAFAFAISATMPRVPYLTYIDAFFLECYVFVFIAIVELMAVHVTHRSDRRRDIGLLIRKYSRFAVPAAFLLINIILIVHFLG